MIAIDASVLASALADDGIDGDLSRSRLRKELLTAPDLIDLEVASVLRRQCVTRQLTNARARRALTSLVSLPLRRVPQRLLLSDAWALRSQLNICDALYVALAQLLGVTLVTGDARLRRSFELPCQVEVLGCLPGH